MNEWISKFVIFKQQEKKIFVIDKINIKQQTQQQQKNKKEKDKMKNRKTKFEKKRH